MLPNFFTYIQQESERWGDVLEELQQLRYKKVLFIGKSDILMLQYLCF